MDRRFFSGLVPVFVAFALSGCTAGSSFLHHTSCHTQADACGDDCPCGEPVCEPLITSSPCANACCAEDGGCTGEGCDQKRRRKGRHTGLAGGIERGQQNIVLDGAGWIVGIPSKLLLWNTKVDSHSVSPETERQIREYLAAHGLDDVKVRINQYDPINEWKRLAKNKSIHAGWRYTFGAYAVTKYTILPGRLFGADEYNPFTNSISLYSDRASLALREGAHAKQAIEATYPGAWAASSYLPLNPLWVDTPAIREVIDYSQKTNQRGIEREAYLVLFPAYGARLGGSVTLFLDTTVGQAAQGSFALAGHAVGRTMAFRVSETPMQMVKSVYGIVKRPVDSPADADTAELQNPMPPGAPFPVKFIPIEVIFVDDDSI